MTEWLAHPAVQAAVVPFVVALVAALALGNRWPSLAVAAGFCAAVALAIGWDIEPLSASRKAAFIGVAAGILGALATGTRVASHRGARVTCSIALGAASLWVITGLLRQMEPGTAALTGLLGFGFVALMVYGPGLSSDSVRSNASACVLAGSAGVLALLAASALLATFAIAAAAAAGAVLLLQLTRIRSYAHDRNLVLPCTAIAALVVLLAVVTGGLPAYCALPLLAVPWVGAVSPFARGGRWLGAGVAATAATAPAIAAIALAAFH
jgi:hypothetical protein